MPIQTLDLHRVKSEKAVLALNCMSLCQNRQSMYYKLYGARLYSQCLYYLGFIILSDTSNIHLSCRFTLWACKSMPTPSKMN